MENYKGIFYNDEKEKKYYEGGAHFKYSDLVKKLLTLKDYLDKYKERHYSISKFYGDLTPKSYQENIEKWEKIVAINASSNVYEQYNPRKRPSAQW